jgi:hypothetical protein
MFAVTHFEIEEDVQYPTIRYLTLFLIPFPSEILHYFFVFFFIWGSL